MEFQKKIRNIFTPEELQKTAIETGFYKRNSKFTPSMFFDILLHSASKGEHISLEQSSSEMLDSYDISITKQSIDAKFNESAVKFMQTILSKQISNQIGCNINPVNTNLKMFFDMAKNTNLNPISKRNGVKNEFNAI